jgi:hypothetical protein
LPDFRGENTFMEQAWAHEPKELRGLIIPQGRSLPLPRPSENMKDTDRVIMVKSDGRFGRIVTAIRSRRSQEATSPQRGVPAEGTTIEPGSCSPTAAAAGGLPPSPDPSPSTATPEVSPGSQSPLVDPPLHL